MGGLATARRERSNAARALAAAAVVFAWLAVVAPASAHRAPFTLSSVEWNADTGALEVIHRLHTHHALEAVWAAFDDVGPAALDTPASQARLGLYVETGFVLRDAAGEAIALDFVGVEVKGDHVFVYQEAPLAAPPRALSVRSTLMHELFEDQRNQVNVAMWGAAQTLVFRVGDDAKVVAAAAPVP